MRMDSVPDKQALLPNKEQVMTGPLYPIICVYATHSALYPLLTEFRGKKMKLCN